MAFHDVTLPDGFDYGSAFGAGFQTVVQVTASGHEYRIGRQSQARHRFRLLRSLQSPAEAQTIKDFAIARRGALHSFRIKDLSDYTSNADGVTAPDDEDQTLGTGDGVETDFQIIKTYGAGTPAPYTRTIELPVSATVVVALDGVASASSNWSIVSGGILRFNSAPGNGVVVTAGYEFDVPVRFEATFDQWATLEAQGYNAWNIRNLDCIEVLSEVAWPETYYPGGSTDHGTVAGGNVFLDFNDGQLHVIEATAATTVYLPDVSRFTPGGPNILSVYNDSTSTSTIQIRDLAGNAIGSTHAADTMVRLALVNDGSSVRWVSYV